MAINRKSGHWTRTRREMLIAIGLWFILGFAVHMFVIPLNNVSFIGFPIGYYMAAQGSVLGFILLIFWHAARQDVTDREFGVSEDS